MNRMPDQGIISPPFFPVDLYLTFLFLVRSTCLLSSTNKRIVNAVEEVTSPYIHFVREDQVTISDCIPFMVYDMKPLQENYSCLQE